MIREEYASVRATPSLVGRNDILMRIHQVIQDRSVVPHVFYITAPGGWGKTRLVDAILKKLDANGTGEWASPKTLSALRLVDLYHTYTHSDEGVMDDIVNVLDTGEGGRFQNYIVQRAELDRVKHDLSQTLRTVTQHRMKMTEAFINDFNSNSSQYEKVVIAFDTVENLTYEPDRVQVSLGLAEEPTGVAGWLVRDFLPKIHNTVVLIAGRPETPQLNSELENLSRDGKIVLEHIGLQTFTEEETLAYFEAVSLMALEENPRIAERLKRMPEEIKLIVHYLSGGEPFILSLFVDYLITADKLLPQIQIPIAEIKKSLVQDGLKVEREMFREAILQGFQRIRGPFDDVIRTLAWTQKGMGATLLAWILKRNQPTEEEIEQAREYIRELRNPEFRLSFVKVREIDNLVFLQDEMYKLIGTLQQRSRMRHNAKLTYELITRFYEEQIKEQALVVNELDKSTRSLFSSSSWKELTEGKKKEFLSEQQMLRATRARLQSYQVEHVYYCLQADYLQGLRAYYRAAEGAFQSNDTNLWLLLRAELLRFAKQHRHSNNENDKEVLRYIDGDIGVRWIKSNIASGQYDLALKQIERFRITCSDLLEEGSFADISLKIWESWALTYCGRDYQRTREILESVLFSLKNGLTDTLEDEFDEWRSNLLTAYAQDIIGYMYRSQGNFKRAIDYYQKNIRLWRNLNVPSELANTLNNLSWALMEVGDFQSSIEYCEDGLNLRRKLGHRYPIATSLNTLGLIETRTGQPERARFRCEQALAIFRDLRQPRGIGLGCIALAESLRRMTNISDLLTSEQAIDYLKLAEQNALEAVEIFQNNIKESLRLVEAYIELGCDYREIARWKTLKYEDPIDFVVKGEQAFDLAFTNSKEEFAYRGVDALVNKAWMYYYVDNFEKAGEIVNSVIGMIQPQYLFTNERIPIHGEEQVPWYWVQLGKAYLLLGVVSFKKYEQARKMGEEDKIVEELKDIGKYWTLSFAYDAQYGKDFRDVKSGRKIMYNCLTFMNSQEFAWIRRGIENTKREYIKAMEFELFEEYISEKF